MAKRDTDRPAEPDRERDVDQETPYGGGPDDVRGIADEEEGEFEDDEEEDEEFEEDDDQ
jgi:hypothetical protein